MQSAAAFWEVDRHTDTYERFAGPDRFYSQSLFGSNLGDGAI